MGKNRKSPKKIPQGKSPEKIYPDLPKIDSPERPVTRPRAREVDENESETDSEIILGSGILEIEPNPADQSSCDESECEIFDEVLPEKSLLGAFDTFYSFPMFGKVGITLNCPKKIEKKNP